MLKALCTFYWQVFVHKWYVNQAGRKLKVSLWRRVTHDFTKMYPWHAKHYARHFFGDASDTLGFVRSWVHHQNTQDHHWEYWVPRTDGLRKETRTFPLGEPLPISTPAIKEMVADWFAACRAYDKYWPSPGKWPWFYANYHRIILNPATRNAMDAMLSDFLVDAVFCEKQTPGYAQTHPYLTPPGTEGRAVVGDEEEGTDGN